MSLLDSFQSFLRDRELIADGDRLLAAVSGGVDSAVLAHLLWESRLDFGILHCNFQLRGAESDADEAFVRTMAAQWNVPVFHQRFDTKAYALEHGLSTQMAARALRYAWFEQIRLEFGYTVVATAHQLNDSIETALLNFIRGTGLTGLTGIPVRNERIIRPLLFASRAEILEYAESRQLTWREDSSNDSDQYTRNKIRRHILPRLEEINPALLASAGRTLQHAAAADLNLKYLLQSFLGQPDPEGVYRLEKKALSCLPALQDALFEILQPFGFSPEQVRQMAETWSQTGAEWSSSSGWRLLNDRTALLLFLPGAQQASVVVEEDDLLVRLPDSSRVVFTPSIPGASFPDNQMTVVIDADKLQFPLILRHWKPGDVFQPLGMQGRHQKLQDFFTNLKLSKLEKEHTWILENSDKTVIWVLGKRLDDRYKVSSETCKLLKISWLRD